MNLMFYSTQVDGVESYIRIVLKPLQLSGG